MTNEEYIKSLTTDELAEWLFKNINCPWCPAKAGCEELCSEGCRKRFAEWLKEKKVKEEQ